MDRWQEESLKELREFFVSNRRWTEGLFQVLFVLVDAKPGVWLQQKSRTRLRELSNILRWYDLYVSRRHGGYATKDESLYIEWNRLFGFKLDAERFLGYPRCCVRCHHDPLSSIKYPLGIYRLVRHIQTGNESRTTLRDIVCSFNLLPYMPCSVDCEHTYNLSKTLRRVVDKYEWLVGDLLRASQKRHARGLAELLDGLPSMCSRAGPVDDKALVYLDITHQDYMEVCNRSPVFQRNVAYGKQLLDSLLPC